MQRLSDDTLLSLLHDLESDRVERKETFKGDVPKKASKPCVPLRMTCQSMTRPAFCSSAHGTTAHPAASKSAIGFYSPRLT